MRKARDKNLRNYAFEFLSIFIAVISAFALNNWNENRNNRMAESKILLEIHSGLEKDLEDIRTNQLGHEAGLLAVRYFRDMIAKRPVAQDSFIFHYTFLLRDLVCIQNTSGCETLKSKGLELIQNDQLRTDIVSLYEYDYSILQKIEEEYHELQFHESYFHEMNRLLSPYAEFDEAMNVKGIRLPLELAQEDERALLIYLWKIAYDRNFILRFYKEVENKIVDLREVIDDEL